MGKTKRERQFLCKDGKTTGKKKKGENERVTFHPGRNPRKIPKKNGQASREQTFLGAGSIGTRNQGGGEKVTTLVGCMWKGKKRR